MPLCSNGPGWCAAAWLVCAVNWFVVTPWSLYRFRQLWIRAKVQLLHTRRVKNDIVPVGCLNGLVSVTLPLLVLRAVAGDLGGREGLFRLMNSMCIQCVGVSIVYKILLSHVDLSFAYVTRELSWKTLIIDDLMSRTELGKSKYIQWRQSWLSPKYLALLLTAYLILGCSVLIIEHVLRMDSLVGVTNMFFVAALVLGLLYMWCGTPSIIDSFGIRDEIKYISFVGLFEVCAFSSVFLAMRLSGLLNSPADFLASSLVFWIGAVGLLFVFTEHRFGLLSDSVKKWDNQTAMKVAQSHTRIQRATNTISKQQENLGIKSEQSSKHSKTDDHSEEVESLRNAKQSSLALVPRAVSLSVVGQGSPSVHGSSRINLNDQPTLELITQRLFAHPDCVACFADFLFREISIENLIGFVEFYQFTMDLKSEMREIKLGILSDFTLDVSVVPRSTINEGSDYGEKFVLLCDKYVGQQSRFRLNLAFSLSQKIDRLMRQMDVNLDDQLSKEDLNEMLSLCTLVVMECVDLLRDSFSRFKQTPLFDEFLAVRIG